MMPALLASGRFEMALYVPDEDDEVVGFEGFQGANAESYAFYRFPKALIKDSKFKYISEAAKILYGIMLDMIGLSIKNQWIDGEGEAYIIYTLEDVMEDLNCADNKATKVMNELVKCGLIAKKKQGFGLPNLIYVKDFNKPIKAKLVDDNASDHDTTIVKITTHDRENHDSLPVKTTINESRKSGSLNNIYNNINTIENKTDIYNKTKNNKTENNKNNGLSADMSDAQGGSHTSKTNYSDDFQRFWEIYPRKDTKAEAFKCFKTRMGEGFSPDDMIKAAQVYADDCKKRHREKEYTMQPKTFLGQNLRFTDYLPKVEEPKGLEKGKWDPKSGMTPRQWYQCKWTEELGKETGLDVFQWNYGLLN